VVIKRIALLLGVLWSGSASPLLVSIRHASNASVHREGKQAMTFDFGRRQSESHAQAIRGFGIKRPLEFLAITCAIGGPFLPMCAHAQSTIRSQGIEWSISKGVLSASNNADMLCISVPDAANRGETSTALARVSVADNQGWSVSFAIRFGPLNKKAGGIRLRHGETVICQVLADGFTGNMGGFLGKDMPFCNPVNTDWHDFKFVSDRSSLTLWHEGRRISAIPCTDVPDNIEVRGGCEPSADGQDPIVSVRNLVLKSGSTGAISDHAVTSIADTFASGPLPGLWNLKPNGGSIQKHGSELQFLPSRNQDSFGVMSSRDGTLPTGSSWKLSFRFRYPNMGPYGIGFGIQDNKNKDKRPFWSHYDANLKLPRLLMGDHEVVVQNPGTWHDINVCNDHGHWTVDLDGRQVLVADCDRADYTIYFGGDIPSIKPWGWTTLALQSVQIDYTDGPRPPWLADVLKALPDTKGNRHEAAAIEGSSAVVAAAPRKVSTFGLALGVDSRMQAPACPASDGHLIVTARATTLQIPPGSIVEFRPQLNRPDYTPDKLHLLVNHGAVTTKDVFFTRTNKSLPAFVVDAPSTAARTTLVSIVAEDVNLHQIELSSATMVLASVDAPAGFILQDEKVRLAATKNQTPRAIYVFLEDQYLGCLKANLESFAVDARPLPVGQHRFWLITESSDGALHPPAESTITIMPRFKMSSFAQEGTFTVDADKQSIPVHVHREVGTGVNKSYLYVAGNFIGESDKPDFDIRVPVTEVGSGNIAIEAVGVGKDGSLYPAEAIHVNLKNVYTDSAAASRRKYKDLQGVIAQIGAIDQEIGYWYTRACNEPDFVTYTSGRAIAFYDGFERVVTVAYINSITVLGKVGDYLGRCKAAIIKRAQLRLEIGRRYKELGKGDAAKSSLQQAIQEAGEDSGIGTAAAQELRGL